MVTLFEPCSRRTQSELGRLMPMAVEGYRSPASMAAVITLAETPFTFSFLNCGATGEWSSNHCALSDSFWVRCVAAKSLKFTMASHEAFMPSGSP